MNKNDEWLREILSQETSEEGRPGQDRPGFKARAAGLEAVVRELEGCEPVSAPADLADKVMDRLAAGEAALESGRPGFLHWFHRAAARGFILSALFSGRPMGPDPKKCALSFVLTGFVYALLALVLAVAMSEAGRGPNEIPVMIFQSRFAILAALFFSWLGLFLLRRRKIFFWAAVAGALLNETVVVVNAVIRLGIHDGNGLSLLLGLFFVSLGAVGLIPVLAAVNCWKCYMGNGRA